MKLIKTYCFIFLFLFAGNASANKIKKAFEALDVYNYFEAKKLFEESLKRNEVASSYGLSIIYQRSDNPFHNIDSAYNFIQRSVNHFSELDSKKRLKYLLYGVDSLAIINQRNLISDDLYLLALNQNSIEGYQHFLYKNKWSFHFDTVVYMRDKLAFEDVSEIGTSQAYKKFLNVYEGSVFNAEVNKRYEQTLYSELTASESFISYVDFIRKYPNSPFRTDAEDKVFEIYTETGSITSYKNFIYEYPENRNVNESWKRLYNAHVEHEYTPDRIIEFSAEFPDYPYMEELTEELLLINTKFYPFKENDTWGFIDQEGKLRVKAVFNGAEWFKEGLSVVRINEKYGYINKRGQLEIATIFDDALDFNEGHAVVELDGKWGMINRNGEFIVEPEYEDLGNLENGLAYFQSENKLYGYFDSKGLTRLRPIYDMAYDFNSGYAIASTNKYYGLIDEFGTAIIPFKYEDLQKYEDDQYLVKLKGKWGLITIMKDTILNFEFDFIGKFYNNRAIVEKEFRFNYIDMKGDYLMEEWLDTYAEYRQLANFQNAYAKIKFEKGYNLIDTNGTKLFRNDYDGLGDYADYIAILKDDLWAYSDTKGKNMIGYGFSHAQSFSGDYALASNDLFWGVLNLNGDFVVEPIYENLTFLNDSLLIAKRMGNYGILNVEGDTILNFHYISIEPISDLVVKIEEGEEVYYFNLKTYEFIRREE